VLQRLEHILLVFSFTALALTGLAQKFSATAIADGFIGLLGGIETTRVIHHAAAIVLALECVYHVIVLGYKVYVRRTELSMLPGPKDVLDALDVLRYNLGLTKEHPKLPRYNFAEKAEYWAMIWGTIVMGLTGFMLWNPIIVTKFLPGQVIPAAKAAHGGEAILAVLAIIVWHFYNVHFKSFNKAMLTGSLTPHQMEEEHGEELDKVRSGRTRPAPNPVGVRRRERTYIPVALAAAVVMVGVVYWLATAETTAIASLPQPIVQEPVFVPLTPTPAPSATVDNGQIGKAIPHPIVGQEQCDTCHGLNGIKPMPADHDGRPVESCLICHQPGPTPTPGGPNAGASGASGPNPIPADHDLTSTTFKDCTVCHGADKMIPFPASHAGYTVDSCTMCHKPAPASQTAAAGATPEPGTQPAASGPNPIPADHDLTSDTFKACINCHGTDKMKPFPANHASFAADSCQTCHQQAAAAGATEASATPEAVAQPAAGVPPAIPANHDLTSDMFKACLDCHGTDKIKPFPANHASFTADSCQTCHKPAQ